MNLLPWTDWRALSSPHSIRSALARATVEVLRRISTPGLSASDGRISLPNTQLRTRSNTNPSASGSLSTSAMTSRSPIFLGFAPRRVQTPSRQRIMSATMKSAPQAIHIDILPPLPRHSRIRRTAPAPLSHVPRRKSVNRYPKDTKRIADSYLVSDGLTLDSPQLSCR